MYSMLIWFFLVYQMYPRYQVNGNRQFLWSVFPCGLATVQLAQGVCTTSWIHNAAGKRTDTPCTDSLNLVKHWLWFRRVWVVSDCLNYLIEPLVGSGNYLLWMKLFFPKLREELATALNAIFVPISVSYFNLQWKIHKVVAHWVRPSLVHSLFSITACINF